MLPLWLMYPLNWLLANTFSMATFRIFVQVARSAPPSKHIAPPPSARRAENHPVFIQTLLGSDCGSANKGRILLNVIHYICCTYLIRKRFDLHLFHLLVILLMIEIGSRFQIMLKHCS